MTVPPELLTPRLRLRPWRPADVAPMARIYADPAVIRYLRPMDRATTRRQIARFVEHWTEHGFGIWAVDDRSSGRLIGRIGLWHHPDWTAADHDAEVGWTLERRSWGRGLATEGGRAALEWGRNVAGLEAVISIAHRDNHASQRVMARLGLEYGGATTWRGDPVVWYCTRA